MRGDGGVGVEFSDAGTGDIGAGFADILGVQEELGGKVGKRGGGGVKEGEGFDAGEGDVLG